MWKMGFYLQGQGYSNWISVHTMKYDYFCYMFWTADFVGDQLSLTVHVHKQECLVKRLLCCIQVKVTVMVLNYSECLPGQYLWSVKLSKLVWWCIIISQSVMWKYHFAMFKVKATIISTRSSEILKLLQSKLVWWYIITRQGKIPWKDFLAVTQGMRQRIWLGWLWTRLLPLLPIPISILVPIKKMWKEHCFCNECTCLLILLVNGSSISFCTWDDVYITCETDY